MKIFPTLSAVALLISTLSAADWPQWLGTGSNARWTESGLVKALPKSGAKVVWKAPVANGYAGPAVAAGKVFVNDYVVTKGEVDASYNGRTKIGGTERLLCLDAATGKELWKVGKECEIDLSYPNGPRTTPFVDGDRVYSLGAMGHVMCVNVADGKLLWEKELTKEYSVEAPFWGYSSHPLVVGDLVYFMPGGKGTTCVALNKMTGKEVWRALESKEPGYAPPILIKHGGKSQLIAWHAEALNSLDPLTGKVYWSVPFEPNFGMSIMAPQLEGDFLYIGASVKKSMLLKLSPQQAKPEIVWEGTPKMGIGAKNGTPLVSGDALYGCNADGELTYVKLSTGEKVWETNDALNGQKVNSGTFFLVKATNWHAMLTDAGDLVLADISADGYKEISRARVIEPTTPGPNRKVLWSHPAFANRCVYVRNDVEMICLSLAE